MKSDALNSIRVALVHIGKSLPFVICAIIFISYSESLYALITEDYLEYEDSLVLNKPISWFIGSFFEYNLQMLIVLTIISIAIRTCIFNKLAVLFMYGNLAEKSYFATIELDEEIVYLVVIINILISGFFCYKGLRLLIK